MITSPVYGGAYSYGKTEQITLYEGGQARHQTRRKPQDQWLELSSGLSRMRSPTESWLRRTFGITWNTWQSLDRNSTGTTRSHVKSSTARIRTIQAPCGNHPTRVIADDQIQVGAKQSFEARAPATGWLFPTLNASGSRSPARSGGALENISECFERNDLLRSFRSSSRCVRLNQFEWLVVRDGHHRHQLPPVCAGLVQDDHQFSRI
jgi:hypothetical protein